jgi:hypothetical protein
MLGQKLEQGKGWAILRLQVGGADITREMPGINESALELSVPVCFTSCRYLR